jgi:HSP20 family protein
LYEYKEVQDMTIERWSPIRDIERVQNWLNRWQDEAFDSRVWPFRFDNFELPIDVVETEKSYELKASAPGYKPEEIQVEVKDNLVTIRGEMKEQEKEEKKDNYIYRERKSGSFFRQVRLPGAVDATNVEAHLVDGVLKLDLPKSTEPSMTRIPVKNSH